MKAVVSTSIPSRFSILDNMIENWRELSAMTALLACMTGLFASMAGALPVWNRVFYGGLAIFSGVSWKMAHDYTKYCRLTKDTRSLRKSDSLLRRVERQYQQDLGQSQTLLSRKMRLIAQLNAELLRLRGDLSRSKENNEKLHQQVELLQGQCATLQKCLQENTEHRNSLEQIASTVSQVSQKWKESGNTSRLDTTLQKVNKMIEQLTNLQKQDQLPVRVLRN